MTMAAALFLVSALLLAILGLCQAVNLTEECVGDKQGVCNAAETMDATNMTQPDDDDTLFVECGLYMAPSSIPNAGWTFYTGKAYQKSDILEPVDLAIQVADHGLSIETRNRMYPETLPDWLIANYYWQVDMTGADFDGSEMSIISGLGGMTNFHPAFDNIKPLGIATRQDVDPTAPQAGAYTEYKGMQFQANQEIPVGHELSTSYGSKYFDSTPIPARKHFQKANKILQMLHKTCLGNLETDACHQLWHVIRHGKQVSQEETCNSFMLIEKDCQNLWKQVKKSQGKKSKHFDKIIHALPEQLEQVPQAMAMGTAWYMAPDIRQSLHWLNENGMCVDHIEPRDNSTIYGAGSGAFSKRRLAKGSLVAPAPVIHLHRGHLDILIPNKHDVNQMDRTGSQLLLNYAYGHASTSLLFFPYSPVVNYINHSPTPNVELRWSSRMTNHAWMNLTTAELIQENNHAELLMEIVALRDIKVGEEIVMDYGTDWSKAWQAHVETWQPPIRDEKYRSAESYWNQTVLPTTDHDDDEIEPLASNVMTMCWVDLDELEDVVPRTEFRWLNSTDLESRHTEMYECALVSRQNVNGTLLYDADVKLHRGSNRIYGIHRRGIHVIAQRYTSNQYLRQSFRHEIQLPDDMIPAAWKDREALEQHLDNYVVDSSQVTRASTDEDTFKAVLALVKSSLSSGEKDRDEILKNAKLLLGTNQRYTDLEELVSKDQPTSATSSSPEDAFLKYADRHARRLEEMIDDYDCMEREFDASDTGFNAKEAANVYNKCRILVLRNLIPKQVIEEYIKKYEKYILAVHSGKVHKSKTKTNDSKAKDIVQRRGTKRHDVMFPKWLGGEQIVNNPTILNVLRNKNVLGPDMLLNIVGSVIAESGAPAMYWHEDQDYIYSTDSFQNSGIAGHDLLPYVVNMGMVLRNDTTMDHGPTEFCVGSSHIDGLPRRPPVMNETLIEEESPFSKMLAFERNKKTCPARNWRAPLIGIGDVVLFDYHLTHRGGPNLSGDLRSLFYATYSRSWFRDMNFDDDMYSDKENEQSKFDKMISGTRFALVDETAIENLPQIESSVASITDFAGISEKRRATSRTVKFHVTNINVEDAKVFLEGEFLREIQPKEHVVVTAQVGQELSARDQRGNEIKSFRIVPKQGQIILVEDM